MDETMNKNADLYDYSTTKVEPRLKRTRADRVGDRDEVTSRDVARIAARALKRPQSVTYDEIQALAASCLTQRPSKRKPPVTRATVMIGETEWEMTLKPKEW